MTCRLSVLLVAAMVAAWGQAAAAGPYSTGKANDPLINPAAPDAGIPGFVGPDGEGLCLTRGPQNYVNPQFVGWATGYLDYLPSDTSWSGNWNNPAKALGPVTGNNFDIVSLGDLDATEIAQGKAPGQITLTFDQPIVNGAGADLAVFENGFISGGGAGVAGQLFAELACVEVSTDGDHFARFPSISLTGQRVGGYGTINPTDVYNLVGKHANAYGESWGTPFDLDSLLTEQAVVDGLVRLDAINYVRIVDVPGDGSFLDSQGHGIYDAWVTWGSGGLDLDAVGVLHQAPEPTALASGLLATAVVGLWVGWRRKHAGR